MNSIDRMVHQVDASYGDTDPSQATQAYLQTCATLELARQQRETNALLERIASALDRTKATAQAVDSPFSEVQDSTLGERAGTVAAQLDRELSEAELQDCDCVLPEHVCESCVKHAGETEIIF